MKRFADWSTETFNLSVVPLRGPFMEHDLSGRMNNLSVTVSDLPTSDGLMAFLCWPRRYGLHLVLGFRISMKVNIGILFIWKSMLSIMISTFLIDLRLVTLISCCLLGISSTGRFWLGKSNDWGEWPHLAWKADTMILDDVVLHYAECGTFRRPLSSHPNQWS